MPTFQEYVIQQEKSPITYDLFTGTLKHWGPKISRSYKVPSAQKLVFTYLVCSQKYGCPRKTLIAILPPARIPKTKDPTDASTGEERLKYTLDELEEKFRRNKIKLTIFTKKGNCFLSRRVFLKQDSSVDRPKPENFHQDIPEA